jgi:flavodoxin
MGSALEDQEGVAVLKVETVQMEQLSGLDLLIAGSPTRQFRATEAMRHFLDDIPANGLKGVKIAAFDTRIPDDTDSLIWRILVKLSLVRYAAKPISKALEKKGGQRVLPPEGFYVQDTEGPLQEGELERAANWAKQAFSKIG